MNRKIDELGRIVIPIEYRNQLNINSGETLKMDIVNDQIIITKVEFNNKLDKLMDLLHYWHGDIDPDFERKAIEIIMAGTQNK